MIFCCWWIPPWPHCYTVERMSLSYANAHNVTWQDSHISDEPPPHCQTSLDNAAKPKWWLTFSLTPRQSKISNERRSYLKHKNRSAGSAILKLIIILNISLKSNTLSADHHYFVKHIILKVSKKSVIFIAMRSAKVSNFKSWGSVETLILLFPTLFWNYRTQI